MPKLLRLKVNDSNLVSKQLQNFSFYYFFRENDEFENPRLKIDEFYGTLRIHANGPLASKCLRVKSSRLLLLRTSAGSMSQFTVRLPTKITTTRAATAEVVEANMIQDVRFQGQFIEIRPNTAY